MDTIILYEEYRLIEKTELQVNGIWKAAHLLLFFLAFVFGSFCTFCFHMMMYLFDEKCVLFPKLLSLTSFRQNIIYEFIPEDKDIADMLPVDFLSTQWVDKSACLLPTYVPLVSGIFGLVWTTMFLMCSTGSRVLTGLQRPWRVIPPVFLFSLTMGSLCVYTSAVTHYGLQELCIKLSEITGSPTCTYTINVATLAYERRIRGVYQATRLTILSAWLHTGCWVLSTILAIARVLLAVDFQLVKISVKLQGNIDKMLERHERHIRTVLPQSQLQIALEDKRSFNPIHRTDSLIQIHFKNQDLKSDFMKQSTIISTIDDEGRILYYADISSETSDSSLFKTEYENWDKIKAYATVSTEHRFIVQMLFSILDKIKSSSTTNVHSSKTSLASIFEMTPEIFRQYGQQRISSRPKLSWSQTQAIEAENFQNAEDISSAIKQNLQMKLNRQLSDSNENNDTKKANALLNYQLSIKKDSEINLNIEKKEDRDHMEMSTSKGEKKYELKSNLKQVGIQTDEKLRDRSLKVQIDSYTSVFDSAESTKSDVRALKENKNTQTKKEKMD